MSGCAAYGITYSWVYRAIVVGAITAERIISGQTKFLAGLPPAVLADNDARIQIVVKFCARAHPPCRGCHYHPRSRRYPPRTCGVWMYFDLRIRGALAQAGQATVLRLAEQAGLRARQHEREFGCEVRACHRPEERLDELR